MLCLLVFILNLKYYLLKGLAFSCTDLYCFTEDILFLYIFSLGMETQT